MGGHKRFSEFAQEEPCMDGEKVKLKDIVGKEILIKAFRIRTSKYKKSNSEQCLTIQFEQNEQNFVFFTRSAILMEQIEKYKKELPFFTIIKQVDKYYTFS